MFTPDPERGKEVYNLDRVPYELDPVWILQVSGVAAVVGIVVSALPAYRAARHDPLISLRGKLAETGVDRVVSYSRSLYELATQAQSQLSALVEERFGELNRNVVAAIDKAVLVGVVAHHAARRGGGRGSRRRPSGVAHEGEEVGYGRETRLQGDDLGAVDTGRAQAPWPTV